MKLRNKLFMIMVIIAVLIVFCLGSVAIFQFSYTKTKMENTMQEQKVQLYKRNMEVMTSSQEVNVNSFAEEYAKTLEIRLDEIEQDLIVLGRYVERLYANGNTVYSNYPDTLIYLQPGIVYEDVEQEFHVIQSLRDMMHLTLKDGDTAMIYYVSESGMLLSDMELDYGGADVDRRERQWYLSAKEKGTVCWMPPYEDALTGEMTLTCSIPVTVDGTFKGVIAEDIYLSDVCDTILFANQEVFEDIFLVSQEGIYISGMKGEYNGTLKSAVDEMRNNRVNGTAVRILNDEQVMLGCSTIENTGWCVFVALSYDRLSKPVENVGEAIEGSSQTNLSFLEENIKYTIMMFGVVAVIILLLIIFVSSKLAYSLVNPIEKLTEGAGIISKGNLNYQLDVQADGEIRVLADTFQKMTIDLKEYISNLEQVTAERERIGAELGVAARIQEDMLPKIFPAFPERDDFDVIATMSPAKAVGGDFYDFFMIDEDHFGIVISDVSSKGVPAALFMVIAKTLIKNYACQMHNLGEVYSKVNNQLCEGNDEGMFVTSWMAVITLSTGEMEYVNAGHNPQLWLHGKEAYDWITIQPGFVLAGIPEIVYKSQKTVLNHGDRVFLYTDGVSEAQNRTEELFGEERLLQSINQHGKKPLNQVLGSVRADVDQFVDGAEQFDDITMLIFEYR